MRGTRSHAQSGQTLIETLVALSILTLALVVSLGLATYSFQATDHASRQIIATNLARQGVEAVKSVRDTNWLNGSLTNCDWINDAANKNCYSNWLSNGFFGTLGTSGGSDYMVEYRTNQGGWWVFPAWWTQLYYNQSTGQYSSFSGSPSVYSRKVNIKWDNTPPFDTDTPTRIIVTSTVWWKDRNCPQTTDPTSLPASCKVVLVMHLTNWRTY